MWPLSVGVLGSGNGGNRGGSVDGKEGEVRKVDWKDKIAGSVVKGKELDWKAVAWNCTVAGGVEKRGRFDRRGCGGEE